jgi:hypothetical protein
LDAWTSWQAWKGSPLRRAEHVIDKTRLLLGYNVPAVLLTTQTFVEIGKPWLVADVCSEILSISMSSTP